MTTVNATSTIARTSLRHITANDEIRLHLRPYLLRVATVVHRTRTATADTTTRVHWRCLRVLPACAGTRLGMCGLAGKARQASRLHQRRVEMTPCGFAGNDYLCGVRDDKRPINGERAMSKKNRG